MKQNIVESFEYDGFGFPVVLLQVPVRTFRGVAVPDVDYNLLQQVVLEALTHKPLPLTGNEIRFIRQSLDMTLSEFARHFGLTHPAVIKWEAAKDKFAKITPSTELYIRMYILDHLKVNNERFRNSFVALDNNKKLKKSDKLANTSPKPLRVESRLLTA